MVEGREPATRYNALAIINMLIGWWVQDKYEQGQRS